MEQKPKQSRYNKIHFSTIKTRGPDAYKNLILSLRISDHFVIADMLDIMN